MKSLDSIDSIDLLTQEVRASRLNEHFKRLTTCCRGFIKVFRFLEVNSKLTLFHRCNILAAQY